MQILRGLGYGKYTIEDKIIEEAKVLHDILHSRNKNPIDPECLLAVSVSNVICSLLYGRRFEHDDERFQELINVSILGFYTDFDNIYNKERSLLR